jgi:molybdate transport system substrate-binding protein
VALLAALSLVASACAADADAEVLVSAASSLTDAFGEMEVAFEAANPGVDVVLNLAGSPTLREQVLAGAPADVLAVADPAVMAAVVAADEVDGAPVEFARNRLVVAVPAGNPAGVTGIDDLAGEALLVGLCAEGVPCGDLARQALRQAGIEAAVDTEEPNVRALVAKLAEGELDVGITYETDVVATDDVDGLPLPDEVDVVASYPIAALAGAPNPDGAAAFVDFVLGDEGRAILGRYGFGSP